uniref:Neogenin 1b n=1 Tax=Paramormyrops kingsleyae TaxID=1676925 RepID=A0A3B3TE43_9TELE
MAERGARLLLSLSCLTFLYSTTLTKHADKGPSPRLFMPFWFSVEPVDTLAVRGGPVLLNCSVHSDLPARVDWKKDGTFLNLAADERRQLLADGSLLVASVVHSKHNKPDEGVYQCVASIESLGSIASRTARLSVAGKARRTRGEAALTGFVFSMGGARGQREEET